MQTAQGMADRSGVIVLHKLQICAAERGKAARIKAFKKSSARVAKDLRFEEQNFR